MEGSHILCAASLLTGSGLLALLLQLGGFLSPRISTRTGREALLLAGAGLAVLILGLAGRKVNWSMLPPHRTSKNGIL